MGHLKAKKSLPRFTKDTAVAGQVDREWRTVNVKDLKKDDIIAGMGIVKLLQPTCQQDQYYLEAGEDTEAIFLAEETVYAFVRKDK